VQFVSVLPSSLSLSLSVTLGNRNVTSDESFIICGIAVSCYVVSHSSGILMKTISGRSKTNMCGTHETRNCVVFITTHGVVFCPVTE